MGTNTTALGLNSKENNKEPAGKIILLGTSHIARESIERCQRVITQQENAIIAVELDRQRLLGLLHEEQSKNFSFHTLKAVGLSGFIFALIGSFVSRKLGNLVQQKPGAEMLTAVKAAQERKFRVALLDQDLAVTLRRFSTFLTWQEKGRIVVDLFLGVFSQQSQLKKYGLDKIDLRKVPSTVLISKLIAALEQRYPNIYRVLISERNAFMVHRLLLLHQQYPSKNIIAVVGAGHVAGMRALLDKKGIVIEKDK